MQSIILFVKSIFSSKSKIIYLLDKSKKICDSILRISTNEKVKYNCLVIKNIIIEIEGLI
jgi:hypothetical protein